LPKNVQPAGKYADRSFLAAHSPIGRSRLTLCFPSGTGTACPSAQPCSLAGAQAAVRALNDARRSVVRAVTGWTLADAGRTIWRADAGAGTDTRQPYVDGAITTRSHAQVNRPGLHRHQHRTAIQQRRAELSPQPADQSRIQMESVNSFTDRRVSVQSVSGTS
jgi:hypothetical protein